jgi:hypothetical protein
MGRLVYCFAVFFSVYVHAQAGVAGAKRTYDLAQLVLSQCKLDRSEPRVLENLANLKRYRFARQLKNGPRLKDPSPGELREMELDWNSAKGKIAACLKQICEENGCADLSPTEVSASINNLYQSLVKHNGQVNGPCEDYVKSPGQESERARDCDRRVFSDNLLGLIAADVARDLGPRAFAKFKASQASGQPERGTMDKVLSEYSASLGHPSNSKIQAAEASSASGAR